MSRKKIQARKTQADQPFKQAIALHYNEAEQQDNPIPKVTATGQNEVAEEIIALAKEHGIPIHEDPELTILLSQLELYEDIPESLYRAVAEVLAFAYIVSGKKPEKYAEE